MQLPFVRLLFGTRRIQVPRCIQAAGSANSQCKGPLFTMLSSRMHAYAEGMPAFNNPGMHDCYWNNPLCIMSKTYFALERTYLSGFGCTWRSCWGP